MPFLLRAWALPWLLGPVFTCLIVAFAGLPMRGIRPLNEGMRTILGDSWRYAYARRAGKLSVHAADTDFDACHGAISAQK
tara:strand:+ start:132 stop:371 length:240 start_codon:yes stop_codon:yes gene_type:complete